MIRILSTLLFILMSFVTFGQSINDLKEELKTASSESRIMNIKYDLAELYKEKTRDLDAAARYAFESYDLARKLKDEDMLILASYLDAEIHLARRQYKKANARFKASLRHSKNAGDFDFAIENLQELEKLAKRERNSEEAKAYREEAEELRKKTASTRVASPREQSTTSSSSNSSSSASSRRRLSSSDIDYKKLSDKNAEIIRKLKLEKADLEETNNNLLSKLERISNNKMSASDLKRELAKEAAEKAANEEEALLALTEKEQELARLATRIKKAERNASEKESEFKKLSEEALVNQATLLEYEKEAAQNKNVLLGLAAALLFILLLATIFYNRFRANKKAKLALQETNEQIEEARQQSDELLLNILPEPIAAELKMNGKASAQKFENVTVLFTDFRNFSRISERLTPEQLVRELDYCFRGFDFIISQYEIEKIKTIGDAYMCATGLTDRKTTPIKMIKAAMEMQEFLEDYKKERMVKGLPYFEARIGIHTGPVVAGVVGVNKFAYDIWGDTVNIAARMEANCEVGKVNISDTTYRQVKYNFDCDHRGKIEAKNKGYIDMYYVKQSVGQPA